MSMTRETLMELVHYDPATGLFTSKVRRGKIRVGDVLGNLAINGYVQVMIHGERYFCHRLAWLYVHGYFPKELDHINRIRSDNRLINLRECNRSENVFNAGMLRNNTSGRKGVSWDARGCLWRAYLAYTIDGARTRRERYCKTFEEACQAREEFERELNSEFLSND